MTAFRSNIEALLDGIAMALSHKQIAEVSSTLWRALPGPNEWPISSKTRRTAFEQYAGLTLRKGRDLDGRIARKHAGKDLAERDILFLKTLQTLQEAAAPTERTGRRITIDERVTFVREAFKTGIMAYLALTPDQAPVVFTILAGALARQIELLSAQQDGCVKIATALNATLDRIKASAAPLPDAAGAEA